MTIENQSKEYSAIVQINPDIIKQFLGSEVEYQEDMLPTAGEREILTCIINGDDIPEELITLLQQQGSDRYPFKTDFDATIRLLLEYNQKPITDRMCWWGKHSWTIPNGIVTARGIGEDGKDCAIRLLYASYAQQEQQESGVFRY